MTAAESVTIQANKAHENYEAILACRYNIAANFLELGRLFKDNRDLSFYKLLGHDCFEDFLGDVSFSRAKVYGLIQVYELYVEKLKVDRRDIIEVGTSKLLMLAPVVESAPEEWIGKAKSLSKSDLRLEITGQAAGANSPRPLPPARPAGQLACVNGCAGQAERGHMPVTRGAGGEEVEEWWVPMCRKCHTEFHQDPKEWVWTYRKNWARYLYSRIAREA